MATENCRLRDEAAADPKTPENQMNSTRPPDPRASDRVRAAPRAALLIESMRDVGYTMESALADIVDNAIGAKAKRVRILADTTGSDPRLGVIDDGEGMWADELIDAMRLGNRSPLEDRGSADLGRFGLGLKTASFSQCRRLTVVSRKDGRLAAARWDLDDVQREDDWLVEVPADPTAIPLVEELTDDGTLVLWEKLDRLLAGEPGEATERHVVRRLSEAAAHLELVFHRFLAGERGLKRVRISLNGRDLEPFDPFHSSHPATIAGPIEQIPVGRQRVTIQAFTLPHHKKLASAAEWEKYAGPAGYIKNQGFYVYRAGRLIIHGTWFGLARQTDLTKLARVKIDMPNGLDAEWKIDIKKASAQPPPQVRERLRQLIETIGATSKDVYTKRGRRLISDSRLPVWQRVQDKNEIRYRVNPEHPVIAAFLASLPEEQQQQFNRIVEMISAAIPIDALFADVSAQPTQVAGTAMSPEALEHVVRTTFDRLLAGGIEAERIAQMLQVTEPFRSNWDLTRRILEETQQRVPVDA